MRLAHCFLVLGLVSRTIRQPLAFRTFANQARCRRAQRRIAMCKHRVIHSAYRTAGLFQDQPSPCQRDRPAGAYLICEPPIRRASLLPVAFTKRVIGADRCIWISGKCSGAGSRPSESRSPDRKARASIWARAAARPISCAANRRCGRR